MAGAALLCGIATAEAQDASLPKLQLADNNSNTTQVADAPAAPPSYDPMAGFFANWFARVDAIQAAQPHWMTPAVTVTPRLEEEFRYDQYFETLGKNKGHLDNFDGGKGLELIPFDPVEVIIGMPPYIEKSIPGKPSVNGLNDWPFLLVKYRILSANEQNGNYILTAFLQGSAPTGIAALTSNSYMITPTIAGGIGFGDFDVQMTLGESFPVNPTTVRQAAHLEHYVPVSFVGRDVARGRVQLQSLLDRRPQRFDAGVHHPGGDLRPVPYRRSGTVDRRRRVSDRGDAGADRGETR